MAKEKAFRPIDYCIAVCYIIHMRDTQSTTEKGDNMKIKVTFTSKLGHEIVEMYDTTPHANGFVPDYKLRASALNWTIKSVEQVA
jgi:hypothetical protein